MKEFDEGCAPFKISPIFDPVILTKVNARVDDILKMDFIIPLTNDAGQIVRFYT